MDSRVPLDNCRPAASIAFAPSAGKGKRTDAGWRFRCQRTSRSTHSGGLPLPRHTSSATREFSALVLLQATPSLRDRTKVAAQPWSLIWPSAGEPPASRASDESTGNTTSLLRHRTSPPTGQVVSSGPNRPAGVKVGRPPGRRQAICPAAGCASPSSDTRYNLGVPLKAIGGAAKVSQIRSPLHSSCSSTVAACPVRTR